MERLAGTRWPGGAELHDADHQRRRSRRDGADGDAIKGLVYDVDLPPFSDLRWKFQNYVDDPFKPCFKNWLCLPWWPDQCMDIAAAVEESLALLDETTA